MRKYKILLYVYQIWVWLVYIPSLLISTLFCGSFTILMQVIISPKVGSYFSNFWGTWNIIMTPSLINSAFSNKIDKKQSYVLVANHQSQYDIFVLFHKVSGQKIFVQKKELSKVPFFGWATRNMGNISVDRSNPEIARKAVQEATKNIPRGARVIFFAEGTRGMSDTLGEFKKGAFHFALDAKLPILPVSIIGTRNILPDQSFRLFPGRAKVICHDPIDTSTYSKDTIDDLISKTKNIIQQGIQSHSNKA